MYTELKCIIPVDKRDRTVITQDMLGEYTVDEAFFKEFERVRQVAAPPAQRPQNARQARGPPTRPQHQRTQHQINYPFPRSRKRDPNDIDTVLYESTVG